MKRIFLKLIVITSALLLGACNTEKEKSAVEMETVNETTPMENTANNGNTSIKNLDKNAERTKMIKKRRAELENITPIDKAKFDSWVPETLGDLKRTSFEFNATPVKGEATYMNQANGKNIEVSIFDGAGEDGAFRFSNEANFTGMEKEGFKENTGAEMYQVKIRNGEYSGEYYYQADNSSKINTIVEDRYIISATGYKMSTDELWKYIESMNFKEL